MHWALVINRGRHQGQLEHPGRLRLLLIVKDGHSLSVLLRRNTETAVWKIYQPQKVCQRNKEWREPLPEEKVQVDNATLATPQPNCSVLEEASYTSSISLVGGPAPQWHFYTHHTAGCLVQPFGPAAVRLCYQAGIRRTLAVFLAV